jgi:hypothetical protein
LYINKDRSKTEELLRTVNSQPQIKALFVTVDLPVVSKREADERVKNETFMASSLSGSRSGADQKGSGLARSVGSFIDPSFAWDDLAWLRRQTRLPIVLKGVQSAADARIALHMGCQGIVVSNHGGRALDGAPAAILVLLELHKECPEVFEHMEVFIDGGIRRGSDILKAICLGASGVGLGRPFLYALNYDRAGVVHLINSKSFLIPWPVGSKEQLDSPVCMPIQLTLTSPQSSKMRWSPPCNCLDSRASTKQIPTWSTRPSSTTLWPKERIHMRASELGLDGNFTFRIRGGQSIGEGAYFNSLPRIEAHFQWRKLTQIPLEFITD